MNDEQVLLDAPAERPCTHRRVHHQHGTLGRYLSDRCRCRACREANTAYQQDRQAQLAHGTWQKYVEVAPVREHIEHLQRALLTFHTIAERAGVGVETVRRIASYRDPPRRVRVDTAKKIRAVTALGMQHQTPSETPALWAESETTSDVVQGR